MHSALAWLGKWIPEFVKAYGPWVLLIFFCVLLVALYVFWPLIGDLIANGLPPSTMTGQSP